MKRNDKIVFISKFVFVCLCWALFPAMAAAQTYDEPYRPQFHFTPAQNWMNDPNGLVWYKGEYHLFYQYNPFGNIWGHMSWGHAVSRDLVHWEHLPVALAEEGGVMIFSGSAVVDWRNTSGLCRNADPRDKSCLIAIYTGHIEGKNQSQHLAVSNDRGRTWAKFAGNPVLDIGYRDFRDPKVFWHVATRRWVMVVAVSKEQKVRFYGSPDLKAWELLSDFGPAGVRHDGMLWECPDLFELPVAGQPGKSRWVLIVNINPGGVAGGSGGQYFVGSFDGRAFTNDNPHEQALFVDHGADFYAGVTFADVPDGRRILLGWTSNWQYAQKEPTSPWRTAQSLPRVLGLRQTAAGIRLTQQPVAEFARLRTKPVTFGRLALGEGILTHKNVLFSGETLEISGDFVVGKQSSVALAVQAYEATKETVIGYDASKQVVYIDRTNSGLTDFDSRFAARHEAPLPLANGKLKLHVFVDRSSVEVFANDGVVALTDRIFPTHDARVLGRVISTSQKQFVTLSGSGSHVQCLSLKAWQLRSIWK